MKGSNYKLHYKPDRCSGIYWGKRYRNKNSTKLWDKLIGGLANRSAVLKMWAAARI